MVPNQPGFIFASGIESSIPTIDGGKVRMDEMEKCGHYRNFRRDFDLLEDIGIRFLRYGPPLHTTLLGAGRHDWSFADEVFPELRRRGVSDDQIDQMLVANPRRYFSGA